MSVDPEWITDLAGDIGATLAARPDLSPADIGAHLARAVGEELGSDPEAIEAAAERARVDFAKIDRSTFYALAARRFGALASEERRGWRDDLDA